MISITLKELHGAIGGKLHCDKACKEKILSGVCIDSRKIKSGNIFIAFSGEKVDGNDFIASCINKDAGCVVCTREPNAKELALSDEFLCPLIWVNDALVTIQKLAMFWRESLKNTIVIGITGSCGKTSTKELLRNVLSEKFKVTATKANFNNELGLPLTILSASKTCEVLIAEMGMRSLCQIAQLSSIAKPNIGVITNVGMSHLELLGTRDNIAKAKSELLFSLKSGDLAVVNADNDMTQRVLEHSDAFNRGLLVKSFGLCDDSDAQATSIKSDEFAHFSFNVKLKGDTSCNGANCDEVEECFDVSLGVSGKHNVTNALSAILVAKHLGMKTEDIKSALSNAKDPSMRLELLRSNAGYFVINDAYNSSPDSCASSLSTLASMQCSGKKYAVLGDMGELGCKEVELHKSIGKKASAAHIDGLICIGKLARNIASGAIDDIMSKDDVKCFGDKKSASLYLKSVLKKGDLVLVKASHFMALEKLVEELL